MTLSTTTRKVQHNGNGSLKTFSYSFRIDSEDHFEVYITDADGVVTSQTINSDYTATGVGNDNGGTIVFTTAPAATERVTILRTVDYDQQTDYVEGDLFRAETHEDALDYTVMQTQQLAEVLDRCLKYPVTDVSADSELPTAEQRSNEFLYFDADGNLTTVEGQYIISSHTHTTFDDLTLSGTLTVEGSTTLESTLTVSGAATLASTLAVTGAITQGGTAVSLSGHTHAAYLNKNGSVALTGNWGYGSSNISGTGNMYATTFYGDGSNLTGISTTHSGLSGLDYASAGHTGFAPTSHNHAGADINSGDIAIARISAALSDFGANTISGTGDIYAGSFYGDGSNLTGVVSDHGALSGLDDDDHSAIYYNKTAVDAKWTTWSGTIDHDTINNTHNLTTDIDHNAITNNHNLTTDIDHDQLTNFSADEHFTWATVSATIDHDTIVNTHNLTTDIDHDQLTNFTADEHFTQAAISITESQISDLQSYLTTVSGGDHTLLTNIGSNSHATIDTHLGSTSNPHTVTAAQVGNGTAQWNANKLQGIDLESGTPLNGQVYVYNSTSGDWEFGAPASSGTNATQLQGRDITAVAPSVGNYLKWDGTSWSGVSATAEVVDDTSPQLGGDLDLNGNNIDFPTTANISDCLDEDDMASDSATALATQQSIKAYVDGRWATWSGTIDHNTITNNHNLTTDIDHDQLTNFTADEHFTQAAISITESQISDLGSYLENVVEDTSPQLGGNLDTNGSDILFGADTISGTGPIYSGDTVASGSAQVANICYGTGDPPTANTTPIGTIYIKYTA